jgi:hypothetical protein
MSQDIQIAPEIAPELKALIPPLSPDEYAQLEQNILADGCRDPLVLWDDYLLDGHNRFEICIKHGLPYTTVQQEGLTTLNDALIWIAKHQLGRRNITDFVRAELALLIKPALAEQAKDRQISSLKQGESPVCLNSVKREIRTDDVVAKLAGVSRDTVQKVEKIKEKASPKVLADVRSGEISINAAAKTIEVAKEPKPKATPATTVEAPRDELAELREQVAELQASLKAALADNEMMGRVFDADDRLKAAMDEAKRQRDIAQSAERTLAAKGAEFVERAKMLTKWKNRAEKAEKALAKAVA